MQWLRSSLIAGFVVIVPLVISVAAFVWLFQFIDGVMGPVYVRWIGREIPGFGLATLLLLVVAVGAFATNVLGARLLRRGEAYLMKLPVFRGIYSPVKQLVEAFSPDNELSFKRVVLVDDPKRGLVLGFLTKEFTIDGQDDAGVHVAVYVPTNHVYFGDVHIYPREVVSFPSLTVQEGLQVFLTGGMALAERLRVESQQVEGGKRPERGSAGRATNGETAADERRPSAED